MVESERRTRQRQIFEFARLTFGEVNATPTERARRFLEEAIELAQAQGLTPDAVLALVQHVYAKPAGEPHQEVGGCGLTLLAYSEAAGIDADYEERRELDRITALDPAYFRERHNAKARAGVATAVPDDVDDD